MAKNGIDKEELELALLEAIWIMRWNKAKTSMTAVLTVKEARTMAKDVVKELNKAGFRIVKKSKVKNTLLKK